MGRRAATVLCVVLGCVLTIQECPSGNNQGSATDQELVERISALRGQGAYADALEVARQLLLQRRSSKETPAFEIEDGQRLVETIEHIIGLPDSARAQLTEVGGFIGKAGALFGEEREDEALDMLQRMLDVHRRWLGEEHPESALTMRALGNLLVALGDDAPAEKLLRRALEIHRAALGDVNPAVAQDRADLAELLAYTGRNDAAEALYRDAASVYREAMAEDNEGYAEVLSSLAGLRQTRGDYAAAEPLYRKALAILSELHGARSQQVAEVLNDLATLLNDRGDYAGGETILRDLLEIDREVHGDDSEECAVALMNLASALEEQDNRLLAEAQYVKALQVFTLLPAPEPEFLGQCLSNLAYAYTDRGEHAKSEPLYQKALQTCRDEFGPRHPNVATVTLNLARDLRLQGRYRESDEKYREALEIYRWSYGQVHPNVVSGLYSYAGLLDEMGEFERAESLLVEAARVYDAARMRVGTGLARATFRQSPYLRLANARLRLGKAEQAWPAVERYQGRVLTEVLLFSGRRPLSSAEATTHDSLQAAVDELEAYVDYLRDLAAADPSPEILRALEDERKRLLAAQAAWAEFQERMSGRHPLTEGQAFPLQRIQRAISANAALMGWVDVEERKGEYASWQYVIRRSGPVRWARIGNPSGADGSGPFDLARRFRNSLAQGRESIEEFEAAARSMYARFAPLAGELTGVEDLVVIPSGAMLGIPVEALLDDTGSLVGDRFNVSYIPSATVHAWLTEQTPVRASEDRSTAARSPVALLLGDPPFTRAHLEETRHEQTNAAESPAAVRPRHATQDPPNADVDLLRGALARNPRALEQLHRLPGTQREVEWIGQCFDRTTVLLRSEASEQSLMRLAASGELERFDVIHMATHALVDDRRPERSALVLSRANLPDPLEAAERGERFQDGLLAASEILRDWRLDADLVTLSACETGLGKRVGGEGYVGFAQAFFQAGARSLLVSLWKVHDEASALLMRRFYENLTGRYEDERAGPAGRPMSKAAALREAKAWLRSRTVGGERVFEHPSHWSAFILMGNRGPLSN